MQSLSTLSLGYIGEDNFACDYENATLTSSAMTSTTSMNFNLTCTNGVIDYIAAFGMDNYLAPSYGYYSSCISESFIFYD